MLQKCLYKGLCKLQNFLCHIIETYEETVKASYKISCKIGKYRKNSKNWDTLNYYHDCPTNGIVGFYSAILHSKDADRITNRVDTDQTAP